MQTLMATDADAELAELREYLGDAYDQRRLDRWEEEVNEELARSESEEELYRSSEAYLYNLTVFAMSGTKDPYLEEIARHVPAGSRLLDYGCGIGSDGLRLIEAGYEVAFADFDNPSVRYLRWRLERRGLDARIFDLDREQPAGFDLAYAFDVIEHVDDQFDFLRRMEGAADRVLVNFLDEEAAEGDNPLHRDMPIGRLIRHAAGRGLVSYSVHHGRSHLVLYEAGTGSRRALVRSARALARGVRPGDAPAVLLPIPWDFRPWRAIRNGHHRRNPHPR
jgi:SAM-dependent methyltransferase